MTNYFRAIPSQLAISYMKKKGILVEAICFTLVLYLLL